MTPARPGFAYIWEYTEYEAIDAQCEDLTVAEHEIGRLDPVA